MRGSGDGPRRRWHVIGVVAAMVASTVIASMGSPPEGEPRQPRTLALQVDTAANIVQSRKTIGFADSDLYFMTPADVGKTLDMMQSAGVNSVRIMIPWAGIEKTQSTYDWTAVDTVVNAANARGMAVVGLVNATPQWAAKPGTPALSGPPASNAVYADFARRVAMRYRGKISAYEVWNEPNATVFWSTGPDPAGYTQLLKAAYPAIKAGDPNAIVLGGALSPVKHPSGSMTAVDFLRGMYANGAKGSFDALSYHPYGAIKFSKGAYTRDAALYQFTRMRQLMVANGDSKKLIWATEYGVETAWYTDAQQADYIKDMLTKWRLYTYAGPAFIYTTRDGPINAGTYGVWRQDWTARPAVAVILKFTGGAIQTMAVALRAGPQAQASGMPGLLSEAIRAGVVAAQMVVEVAQTVAAAIITAPRSLAAQQDPSPRVASETVGQPVTAVVDEPGDKREAIAEQDSAEPEDVDARKDDTDKDDTDKPGIEETGIEEAVEATGIEEAVEAATPEPEPAPEPAAEAADVSDNADQSDGADESGSEGEVQ